MSLISDTDFLIHSLRLQYLRDVEDPYGPRVISLDPSYNSNPYIVASSLADTDRWPELSMPSSPALSDDDGERPFQLSGARLKYTQTIMGGRTGGLGLRVQAKRASASKRMSGVSIKDDVTNFISEKAPVRDTSSSTPVAGTGDVLGKVADESDNAMSSSQPTVNVKVQEPTVVEEVPVTKVVQFIPKFKGAAEMEARRRIRMAARRGPGAAPPPVLDIDSSDSSSSSSEDEVIPIADDASDSDFDDVTGGNDSLDDGDEFDPDYVTSRALAISSDSASDIASELSGGISSMPSVSNSSAPLSSSHSQRPRLSPVSEASGGPREGDRTAQPSVESLFEMITPLPNSKRRAGEKYYPPRKLSSAVPPPPRTASSANLPETSIEMEMTFTRKRIQPIRPQSSALSALLRSSTSGTNPFGEMYAAISGRGESQSTNVQLFFPHARSPAGTAMDLNVRKDATVEEVIGFALWTYWEEGWLPKLDDGLPVEGEGANGEGDEDSKRETKLSAIGWIMRIAEDDGEVDDDFPPPDRMGKIAKFNADAYAVLEATPAQVAQNKLLESKIQRRPSRTAAAKKAEKAVASALNLPTLGVPAPGSAMFGSALGSVPLSTSLGPSSSHGPQIFLRIRSADMADIVHVSTTISVTAGMYMQEALELVCRKRKLASPKDYALLLADMSIIIPLDRTVASLQGKRELVLVKRSMLDQMGGTTLKATGKTTDPNASIFNRMSDTPEVKLSSAMDYTAAYKKYTIYRKLPMLVTRQERTLAIDGVYVHIMPSNKAKAVFDSGKTSSYHIKSIADCQQSNKSSSTFKLVLNRAGGNKRYDFEAESPKLANEIVTTVKTLKAALERSGTVNKSRRSRHVI